MGKMAPIKTTFIAFSIVVITSVGITLLFTEILLTFLIKPQIEYRHQNLVIRLDRKLIYTIKPGCRGDINSWGYRDDEFSDLTDNKQRRILVVGDSFVFGNNVLAEHTFVKRLEHELGKQYQCLNLGILGYGPDQSFLSLLDHGLQIKPDYVILSIFAANDFNDLTKNKIFQVNPQGKLTRNQRNALTEKLPIMRAKLLIDKTFCRGFFNETNIVKFFRLMLHDSYDLLFENHPDTPKKINIMEKLLQEYRDICHKNDIKFMVLSIPSYENIQNPDFFRRNKVPPRYYFLNEDVLQSLCKNLRIPHLDLRETFIRNKDQTIYDPVDHHFSKDGNQLVAETLKQKILLLN